MNNLPEDAKHSSFAGQDEHFVSVTGRSSVSQRCLVSPTDIWHKRLSECPNRPPGVWRLTTTVDRNGEQEW